MHRNSLRKIPSIKLLPRSLHTSSNKMAACYRVNYLPVRQQQQQQQQVHPFASFFSQIERALAQQEQEQKVVPTVHPKFDVRETETAFEVYADLPGYTKDNISIQWNDDNLIISGQTQKQVDTAPAEAESTEAAEESIDDSASDSSKYQKPTVEDDGEEGFEKVEKPADQSSEKSAAIVAAPAEKKTVSKPASNHRYWVSERSYGKFSRTFPFSRRVDHDNLTAKLADGVLTIVVPKTQAPEPRKIYIN
jgi:HSP20 family protein